MINRYLGDFHEFRCIADQCPATCCSGWAVEIDEDSLKRYRLRARKPEDKLLDSCVDWSEGCFKLQKNGDCAFLQADGLCRMYIEYGEDFFCRTCDSYPRHVEEFPDIRENSLSVSCPVVAKDLMKRTQPLNISEERDQTEDEPYEEFNGGLYEMLYAYRGDFIKIMQDRSRSFEDRSREILFIIRQYQNSLDGVDSTGGDFFENREAAFELLFELEPLQESFRTFLVEAQDIINKDGFEQYFESFEATQANLDIMLEQLVVYFLYTYMCGAVYDDYVYAMTAQAVYNALMIKLLWAVKWIDVNTGTGTPRALNTDELAEIVYRYSRELEHSNENMILLEQLIDEF